MGATPMALRNWPHDVYWLYDKQGNLLYIGMTGEGVVQRIYMHKTQWCSTLAYTMAPLIHSHKSVEYPDALTAHAAEVAAIKAERPPFNLNHNPDVWRRARNGVAVPVNGYPQALLDDPSFILRDAEGNPIDRSQEPAA